MPKQPKPLTPRDVEDAVVEAYLAGALVADLQNRYGLARSTVYAMLKRSGKVPSRFRGPVESETDQMLLGLRQLVQHLEAENAALRQELALSKRLDHDGHGAAAG
jgi:transposase